MGITEAEREDIHAQLDNLINMSVASKINGEAGVILSWNVGCYTGVRVKWEDVRKRKSRNGKH